MNWILDAGVEGFFDAIDLSWLFTFLEHRIGDRRILRLIKKWLHAGIIEGGQFQRQSGRVLNVDLAYLVSTASGCDFNADGLLD